MWKETGGNPVMTNEAQPKSVDVSICTRSTGVRSSSNLTWQIIHWEKEDEMVGYIDWNRGYLEE
jgi:hypothetical protein